MIRRGLALHLTKNYSKTAPEKGNVTKKPLSVPLKVMVRAMILAAALEGSGLAAVPFP